jgi:16S rRNA processing protein RimM
VLLVVGRVGRAHGIRGEVAVEVRTDEPEARLCPGAVLATEPESAGPLTVRIARSGGGRTVLAFEGVDDRTTAEQLRGVMLLAEVDPQARPTEDDEWYDHQLVGLRVQLGDGTHVGEVAQVLHLFGQDLLAVARPDRPELLVPFVSALVPEVDLESELIVIDPPDGMLDEVD